MNSITQTRLRKDTLEYLVSISGKEAVWKSAQTILKTRPDLIELHECLCIYSDNDASTRKTPATQLPVTHRSLIENCLEEKHYVAAIDLLDAFQSNRYHPSEQEMRQMMDVIVNDQIEQDTAYRAFVVLQRVLQTSGAQAYQVVWKPERVDKDDGVLWEGYTDFWKFIEKRIRASSEDKSVQVTRELLLLEHIVNVFEYDMKDKKDDLESSLILQLFPVEIGRVRTNVSGPIQALFIPFTDKNCINVMYLVQRLFKLIILLSYAGLICPVTLARDAYLHTKNLGSEPFRTFVQTIPLSTFRTRYLDVALQDTNLEDLHQGSKSQPLDLNKIVKVYFRTKPFSGYIPSNDEWRHTFMVATILDSYLDCKTLRLHGKVYSGLAKDERRLLCDDRLPAAMNELSLGSCPRVEFLIRIVNSNINSQIVHMD
ncbi:3070_t:CDS:2 [Paraglomus occultum]|uniref:3070_t:CDS:1 n=1 Tax=Paraglomus occultum TaxID=144539 RepID=A0A9N9B0S8_9GLOM|nr:3070_t:CDS:2 [Paraglomus occultum]